MFVNLISSIISIIKYITYLFYFVVYQIYQKINNYISNYKLVLKIHEKKSEQTFEICLYFCSYDDSSVILTLNCNKPAIRILLTIIEIIVVKEMNG